ncbi:leucine Rich repeat-containing domain protein [Necator americanus]|uniref:Leucine Rich repeat-containing domain protein n=1 Tax=Necator americanus TaxID=51031 RepID=W2TD65_NECAM|nr:leucine Rich repeat-containing domain protein [Necator americanus]ETN79136.1 leucine Rich repeat-containing domain protein [Necator americanus]
MSTAVLSFVRGIDFSRNDFSDVDFAENNLPAVPEALFKLKNLRKLDISGNKITKFSIPEGSWETLETLNLSGNGMAVLPDGLVRLTKLQRLYASDNHLTFEGLQCLIPTSDTNPAFIRFLHLTRNNLELVPEGITRCVRLQKLRLNHNRLITLPDGIHLLPDLKELDLTDNDDLVMPPKPNEARKKLAFYNIDFSLEHQRRLAGQSPCSSISSLQSTTKEKDPVARRKDFIRRRKQQTDQEDASKVIQVTIREEMNDESEEFLDLFGGEEIVYIEGARTSTGFFTVEKPAHITRLYRASVNGTAVEMEPVPVAVESLDPRFCFLLDAGDTIWIWSGWKARITVANKARLFAERLNKRDRKGAAAIETCREPKIPEEFWKAFWGSPERPDEPIVEHVPENFVPERKRLYQVNIGMGFLELPQVDLPKGVARQELLDTKCVYILDCTSDIFLWMGKKANRLLKMAGQKMVTELHQMIERPDYTQVSRETENEESMMFRSKFAGWDDIVPVDFTRTSESVSRVPDLKVLVKRDNMMKTDLTALFLDRQPAMSPEESEELLNDCNEDLEFIESFVLEGKKFVRLPDGEFGTFYTMDCYVFLCRYAVIPEESEDEEEEDGDQESQQDFKCVLYFWQGRDASNMGWLHFTFQLQPTFEKIFKDKLEVVRMHQQQENHKFLSHFHRKFVIRRGRRGLTRNLGGKWPELFQMRANGSSVCTRTIQIDCRASELCSGFCHILRAPFNVLREDGQKGIVYVWIGEQSDPHEHEYARRVANEMINRHDECFPVEVIKEGEEPDEFWEYIGGKKKYETDSSFFRYTRLFRCTNEKGYFAVSEKTVDFCQDDLDDDDIMILDNGDLVFLWLGTRASEVEVKLAYKAATVYVAHMRMRQTDRPRTLKLAIKGKESRRFKKCFHAWGRHKVPAGD